MHRRFRLFSHSLKYFLSAHILIPQRDLVDLSGHMYLTRIWIIIIFLLYKERTLTSSLTEPGALVNRSATSVRSQKKRGDAPEPFEEERLFCMNHPICEICKHVKWMPLLQFNIEGALLRFESNEREQCNNLRTKQRVNHVTYSHYCQYKRRQVPGRNIYIYASRGIRAGWGNKFN